MIVVSVGTNEARFDRLLEWVGSARVDEDLVVQHGPSPVRPAGARCVEFMPFEELTDHIARSRVFVTHAGVGSIMVALAAGRRPVVVPRLHEFREAVDDHQLPLAHRLGAVGLVTLAESSSALQEALLLNDHEVRTTTSGTALARDLRGYLLSSITKTS